MNSGLEGASSVTAVEDASGTANTGHLHHTADVPAGWEQGNGAYGGLVVATLVRALRRSEPDTERRLRALHADLVAPLQPGQATVEVEVLRRGRGLTSLSADLTQLSGEVRKRKARASAVYSSARDEVPVAEGRKAGAAAPTPTVPDWRSLDTTVLPFAPPFVQHFDLRCTGPLPTKGDAAVTEGWVWAKVRPTVYQDFDLAALVDCFWPAAFSVMSTFRPMVTVAFSLQLLVDPATVPTDAPLYYRARVDGSFEGFCCEIRELWDGDRLVVSNHQSFAML